AVADVRAEPGRGIEHVHALEGELGEERLVAPHLAEQPGDRAPAPGREIAEQLAEELIEERAVDAEMPIESREGGSEPEHDGDRQAPEAEDVDRRQREELEEALPEKPGEEGGH